MCMGGQQPPASPNPLPSVVAVYRESVPSYCWVCELEPCTDSLLKVSPPEDEEAKNLAEKLARFIADGGPEVETIALQNNRENQAFR